MEIEIDPGRRIPARLLSQPRTLEEGFATDGSGPWFLEVAGEDRHAFVDELSAVVEPVEVVRDAPSLQKSSSVDLPLVVNLVTLAVGVAPSVYQAIKHAQARRVRVLQFGTPNRFLALVLDDKMDEVFGRGAWHYEPANTRIWQAGYTLTFFDVTETRRGRRLMLCVENGVARVLPDSSASLIRDLPESHMSPR